jgi:hypothetical protein
MDFLRFCLVFVILAQFKTPVLCTFSQSICSWEECHPLLLSALCLQCSKDLNFKTEWKIHKKKEIQVFCRNSDFQLTEQFMNLVPPLNESVLDFPLSLTFRKCLNLSFSFSLLSVKFPGIKTFRIEGDNKVMKKVFLSESLFDEPTLIERLELSSMMTDYLSPKHFENFINLEELLIDHLLIPSQATLKKQFLNRGLKRSLDCKDSLSVDWLGKQPRLKKIEIMDYCIDSVPLNIFKNFPTLEGISLKIKVIYNLNV